MSATVGYLQAYAEKTRWKPTLGSKDASKKALLETSWVDVWLPIVLHQCAGLINYTGSSRHCCRLCHVQPLDNGFRSVHRQASGRGDGPPTVDAETHPSTRRSRPSLGRLFHHTFRLRQLFEGYQARTAREH